MKKVNPDVIGKAKRDIKAGETITFVITGNRWSSKDVRLNANGREYLERKAVTRFFRKEEKV